MTDSEALPETFVPDRPTITAAVRLAGRAPSVHNTQPWRWVFDGTRLHLYRDNERLLTSSDPHGRQLVISCGAALHHLRTAFAARGWHTDTVRLPDPARADHLAAIEFRPWPDAPTGVQARARAIETRHTDRLPMLPPRGWAELVHRARMLANPHDIELDVLDAEAGPRLAAASQHATALRRYDMEYQTELHWWTGHSHVTEGVPREALVSDAEFSRVPVGRTFPSAPHSARRGTAEDQAQLMVLSSDNDAMLAWLHAGEALSAVLLECTVAGLASCALTHITELPTARKIIASLLRHPVVPQVVIRVGSAPDGEAPPATPRRPVTDILVFDQG
ncbi:Acg family FMN-binding oxidoreductase [Nocardia sp. NPDC057030]|uniref:Acg family FMN-binding oxidoreductase n=1 Tax=unclassified Nocardia TaxID=2637762 RepID=UPI003642121C